MTNGDKIRELVRTDEGLADFLRERNADDGINYCHNRPECQEYLDIPGGATIPENLCRDCLIKWLKEEPEKEKVSDSDTHWHESVMRTFLANH